jgi:hypothetical protein
MARTAIRRETHRSRAAVLPDVPIRQFVLTMPFPPRFPLAFDGKLLGRRHRHPARQ